MKKSLLIFICGAVTYPTLELLWRGYTHYSMAIAGGTCLVLINFICCKKLSDKRNITKCAVGSLIITGVEFTFGIVVNKVFLLEVWNYSDLPFNLFGQICLPFSIVWFLITIPAMQICDIIEKGFSIEKTSDKNVREF